MTLLYFAAFLLIVGILLSWDNGGKPPRYGV